MNPEATKPAALSSNLAAATSCCPRNNDKIGNSLGFTLVEMLVVIATIGILAALLLLSLSSVKAKAQQIQCVNNLHQQGIGLSTFLSTYAVYPLWAGSTNSYPPGLWWEEQLQLGGFGITNPVSHYWQKGVWLCPSAQMHDGNLDNRPYYGYNGFGVLGVEILPTTSA
ncbi:MAG TPA: prepilin-type N-terminal cleavage/methylation domain-containing protein [Verrucomicrobiae bacterium]|jgi:prepilin-type N-terminal cleavage/methylation domain-containing protein